MTISCRSSRYSCGVFSAFLAVVLMAFSSGSAFAQQQPQHPHPLPPPPLPESSPSSRPVPPGQIPSAPIPGGGPSASLNTSTWTALGPASLQTGGGLVSGRVAGLAVDPTDSNTIYSAAAGGGVWKTTDGGSNWTPLTDNQVTLAMGSIAVAPTNHLRIYAGTGEANNSADSDHGDGILVSSDGGATWTLETAGGAFAGTVIGQIAVDPTNADIAYAALGGYYPQNGIFASQNGIWKTTDGGATWTNLTAGVDADSSATIWSAVVVDPNTPSIIYAAIGDLVDTYGDTGIYRSTDSGTTWTLLSNGPHANLVGRIALAVSPAANTSGQHVLYVAASSTQTYGLVYFGRSDNADAATPTFTNLTSGTPNFLGSQGWYDIAVGVDSTGVVYCAGVENYNLGGQQHVLRSANLGVTWSDISIVNGFEPHTDSHAIAFDSSNRMILGSDGGVFRYDATVPSWTDLNSNLNTIQFTGIGLHPTSATSVVGGSQDNGTEVYNGNLVWTETDGGDGGSSLYSQTNPAECYSIHPVASFGLSAFFRRSSDTCSSWSSATSGISYGGANFYPPFVVDAADGNHLLLGTLYENETTNAATSWTATGSPSSNGFNSGNAELDSIAVAPANGSNPQVIYVATGGTFVLSSHIFVTQNDGLLWTQHDLPACTINGNISAGCRVNQIVTDPNDPTGQTAVAVIGLFSASGSSHVFRTTNGGTWTDITGNLPNLPTWSVQIDTDPSRTIYVSTDFAVYSSISPYSTWVSYGAGLPHAQGVDLELNRNLHLLGLATHGRGAWEIETAPHVTNVSTTAANGTYSSGNSIPIVITFSTAVNVTGTPQLTLDTTPNATATYASGSGTTALTFNYTVQSGQTTNGNATSGHLDYTSGAALSLNGGAIADTSGTTAVLALYAPGAAGSLSANNSIVITGAASTPIVPYIQVNGGAWQQTASVAVNLGDKVNLSGQNISGGSWSWTGPNGYMASNRDIYSVPITSATNVYNLTYTNSGGGTSTLAFTITVNPTAVVPWIQVNGGVWQQVAGVAVNLGDKVNLSGQNISGGSWNWTGPSSFTASGRVISNVTITSATNVYNLTYTNSAGVASAAQAFTITVNSTPVVPYLQVNGGAWQQASSIAVNLGDKVNLSGQNISGGSWNWTGPNSYVAGTRFINNVPLTSATNVYNLTYTNSAGVASTAQAFTITVNSTPVVPYLQVNGGAWQQTSGVAVNMGDKVSLSGQNIGGGSWSWTGPNSFMASGRVINNVSLTSATNIYHLTYTNTAGAASSPEAFTITINPTAVVSYIQVNGGPWQQTAAATVSSGATVNLSGQNISGGSWSWTGPSGFHASTRDIYAVPLATGANTYNLTYTNADGVASSPQAFTITVN